ncbi:MAG: pilus assembly protein PilP [Methyloprofundus sp.]|uniref:pilus assembly protein PilP n=1 Tax=Methyloprofundus sp. TaxID=2020875 RepID=UPI00260C69C5|nr:pilus assembly protein PilP [Methyloprofundus sp.]
MNLSEINWDLNEAGAWPKPLKIGAGALVFLTITGFGYYQFTSEKVAQIEIEQKEVADALHKYQYEWRLAQNLELHQAQYKQIQSSLAGMMKLMPTKAEVANLLVDISQTGLSSGLEFELFKPAKIVDNGDVIELPIDIKVIGQYSELGSFINGLAKLPRIVTIKNIQILPTKNNPLLSMDALITTYREGNNHVENNAEVLDNSSLVCLDHDGLVVPGCEKKSAIVIPYPELEQRLEEKRQNTKPIAVRAIEPMPPVESFLFDPDGLRDPFRPIEKSVEAMATQAVETNGIQPDFNRHREELESYSLDTLRMVGTVKIKSVLWGLIKASDGTIRRVSAGNYLGQNHGRILRIFQDKIEIMEIVPDQPGTWREHQASIALSE